jgi:tetratricopeptide (TPR) repeat protein
VIVPWRETVSVLFGRCGAAREACDAGITSVRQGDFAQGIAAFQQATTMLERQPEVDNGDLAEAYWNLGLAREYSGDYAGSAQAIIRAAELNPRNSRFAAELQNVQRMAEEAQRLQEQGVAPPPQEQAPVPAAPGVAPAPVEPGVAPAQ